MARYWLFLWFGRLVRSLPEPAAYLLADLLGELAYRLNDRGRRIARANMRHALGRAATPATVGRAARGCFRAAVAYYVDLARSPLMDPTEFRDHRLHLTGIQNLIAAHTAGRGVIVTSIHYGNPEYVSRVLAAYHLPFLALVERIEPPELFALMQSYRQIANARFVGADLGGVKEAIRHLRRGGMLAVLVDRDIQHNGIEVPFFGALARVPTGAVDLALRTGAPLLVYVSRRRRWGSFEAVIEPPLPLLRTGNAEEDRRVNTLRLLQRYEPYLRRDPSQWAVLADPIWMPA